MSVLLVWTDKDRDVRSYARLCIMQAFPVKTLDMVTLWWGYQRTTLISNERWFVSMWFCGVRVPLGYPDLSCNCQGRSCCLKCFFCVLSQYLFSHRCIRALSLTVTVNRRILNVSSHINSVSEGLYLPFSVYQHGLFSWKYNKNRMCKDNGPGVLITKLVSLHRFWYWKVYFWEIVSVRNKEWSGYWQISRAVIKRWDKNSLGATCLCKENPVMWMLATTYSMFSVDVTMCHVLNLPLTSVLLDIPAHISKTQLFTEI